MAHVAEGSIIRTVRIPARDVTLSGDLHVPSESKGVVLFAHGGGSGRFSPHNRSVADFLHNHGFATLIMDLLPEEEEAIGRTLTDLRFDIRLLAERVRSCTEWLKGNEATRELPIAYFGASTGAAAVLCAAADWPNDVFAVISHGGRPDLAGSALSEVQAPTLLIVGGEDIDALQRNRAAKQQFRCEHHLEIIPGATHLFEEDGALDTVSRLAAAWLMSHRLGRRHARRH